MTKKAEVKFREGSVSLLVNCFIFILKFWAGISIGSISLIAAAWYTLSDSLSSLVVLITAGFSAKPADDEHPFGYGRSDLIASIFVCVLLGVIAFRFVSESVTNLMSGEKVVSGVFAYVVTTLSILVNEGLAQYSFYISSKTGSDTVRVDAWHYRKNAFLSLIILAGLFLNKYVWWIDSVSGGFFAVLIFLAAAGIIKKNLDAIIGEPPSEDIVLRIKELATASGFPSGNLHHLHIHKYGKHIELTFHLYVEGDKSLAMAHDEVNALEMKIRKEMRIEATIHMEPQSRNVKNNTELVKKSGEIRQPTGS